MTTTLGPRAWLRRFHTTPDAATRVVQVVCLPHAGGAAGYFVPFSAELSSVADVLAVQYPGRQDRWHEPAIDDLHELTEQVLTALEQALDERPLILFGHSMGALVAYEAARQLNPARLYVSGCPAPTRGVESEDDITDDASLLADLSKLGGTDAQLLSDPAVLELILPALRADYRAVRTYQWRPGPEPTCPLTVLTGDRDPRTPGDAILEWKRHGTGEHRFHEFEGDHFYLTDHTRLVAELVAADLTGMRNEAATDVKPGR
ncbi:alpha/beta fold hydrolase [Streptomyces coacervatus]|uniref:Alpha/beta fold hydrolase n=1 Tax=Streptomyces coacervatus TaxID=647381 RepID=A0ABP7IW67_9ACTN|nr:alpha/beta fold hydrolase [Streptomyces coacervatus]MDF2269657.1 alpha/beta fold hydrolase [Streptomyces coacervatus]